MLSLTKKTEYALIAVCHLARARERVISAREIAQTHSIPGPLLMNVLKTLNQSGVLTSVRGARGGYRLAIAPQRLSLADLIEKVEGPVRLVRCVSPDENEVGDDSCGRTSTCPIRQPVQRLHDHLRRFLSGVTVADVAFAAGPARTGTSPASQLAP